MFDTRCICRVTGKTEAAVRNYSRGVAMESTAVERTARAFTVRDAVSLLLVDAIVRRGLTQRVAFAIVAEAAQFFERRTIDEACRPIAVVWPDAVAPIGFAYRVTTDAQAAVELLLSRDTATAIQLADLVRDAMARLLEARRAAKEAHDDRVS